MAKLTLTNGTIFEGTTEEIFAITERFNGVKADEPKPIAEGDIVVITGNTNKSRNKVGDIGKVGEGNLVHVPQRPPSDSENGNWTRESEMRHATPSEIAKYETALAEATEKSAKEAVFTQAGRKPNEYRKGDIVRVSTRADAHKVAGSLVTIAEFKDTKTCGGLAWFEDYGHSITGQYLEIVAFAHNRLDK